ncbi:transferase family protein [Pochonia chlamydosporia 170]|uniref:Transferase family protein n=1 Tax=Pochonia chlamydosporia 170 TaxID=1380566 RepID=A0A179EZS5_METCM|nr:transferase family protein [Pochonia chlamydosporia 170]OAQ58686.1 transferase family protein [Pochonia chlamydosporia 170]
MASPNIVVTGSVRSHPRHAKTVPQAVPLSLLDATTANFALTNAIWLFQRPQLSRSEGFDLSKHLCDALSVNLDAYPQWTGRIKAIQTVDGQSPEATRDFPPHARRFGRLYVQFGDEEDPGVDFITATSPCTVDELHPADRVDSQPLWDGHKIGLNSFISAADIATPFGADEQGEDGLQMPLMAIQLTNLACGGFVLTDWANISRMVISGLDEPVAQSVFDPSKLDNLAAGDINSQDPSPEVLAHTKELPLHRYDWWLSAATCPFPMPIPEPFRKENLESAGAMMPWSEWDKQIEFLWAEINKDSAQSFSQHDAILAHIWSCIARARKLGGDAGPIHCDLVYGVRPALGLGNSFIGSPIIMMNVEMAATEVGGVQKAASLQPIASRIRETIAQFAQPEPIAHHLHSVAYEKSPQRLWQAFLGQRHILVKSWARAGVYDVDFGFDAVLRYVDGVVPYMDGNVVIKEAPPRLRNSGGGTELKSPEWTDHGVDVTIHICAEDMKRLLEDPLLLPSID